MANVERVACTRRVRKIQNTSLLLIFIICIVNYMDRGTLSVANPLIRNELGLSVAEMGVLLSAFLWPYAFTLLVAGAIVDRGKPRRVLTISLIVWSIAQGAAGFIVSLRTIPGGPGAAGRRRGADVPDRGACRQGLVP